MFFLNSDHDGAQHAVVGLSESVHKSTTPWKSACPSKHVFLDATYSIKSHETQNQPNILLKESITNPHVCL